LFVFVEPPVGRARRDGRLLSLPEASLLIADLDPKGTGEDFEVLLLQRMDVQLVTAAGRNDHLGAHQFPALSPAVCLSSIESP
jgi:hypothetical protein